jgi:hypothetical protein
MQRLGIEWRFGSHSGIQRNQERLLFLCPSNGEIDVTWIEYIKRMYGFLLATTIATAVTLQTLICMKHRLQNGR